jgi:hypothetical protein
MGWKTSFSEGDFELHAQQIRKEKREEKKNKENDSETERKWRPRARLSL